VRERFVGRDVPAFICCVGGIWEDHYVAVCVGECRELRAFEAVLRGTVAPVWIYEDWRTGLEFGGEVEVERYVCGVGAEGVFDLDEGVGCAVCLREE